MESPTISDYEWRHDPVECGRCTDCKKICEKPKGTIFFYCDTCKLHFSEGTIEAEQRFSFWIDRLRDDNEFIKICLDYLKEHPESDRAVQDYDEAKFVRNQHEQRMLELFNWECKHEFRDCRCIVCSRYSVLGQMAQDSERV